jgi:hypothetical protein
MARFRLFHAGTIGRWLLVQAPDFATASLVDLGDGEFEQAGANHSLDSAVRIDRHLIRPPVLIEPLQMADAMAVGPFAEAANLARHGGRIVKDLPVVDRRHTERDGNDGGRKKH